MTRAAQSELIRALASVAAIPEAEIGATVAKRLGKCLSIIRESTPEVTIEEMRARYRMHRKYWPDCKVTPESLAKRWSELSAAPKLAYSGDSGAVPEPAGWRDHAETVFAEMDPGTARYLAQQPWDRLPEHLKRKVVRSYSPHDNVVPFKITA